MAKTQVSGNKAIKEAYDQGMQEVQTILFSFKSTPVQRKAAKASLNDLTAMLLAHTIDTVQGRTALLAGLIVELTQVIEKVQVRPPFAGAVNKLAGAVGKAQKLLDREKKGLLS